MEKRYQVFVSSTYEDLREERQEVMQALLEMDCIPCGMELFPAADDDQWTLIKRVIDDCDYYIVILGGRYGSTGTDGIGYTEKEYQYALESGKPIIGFLHKDPGELPAKKTEETEDGKQKLECFRKLVQKKMCNSWEGPGDLGGKVISSLVKLIRRQPGIGWVRADELPSDDAIQEILALRKKVEGLERELENAQGRAPEGAENLAQGQDEFEAFFRHTEYSPDDEWDNILSEGDKHCKTPVTLTWNGIFSAISPSMLDEAAEYQLRNDLSNYIKDIEEPGLLKLARGRSVKDFKIEADSFRTIIVQLRALGLIARSERPRSLKDNNTYWKLTPYGDAVMTSLRAIRRK